MMRKRYGRIMEPIIRAGETYRLASDMSKADALAYWNGPEDETFVVEEGDEILGTYHLRTIGTVPLAFLHPKRGYVDVLVMFKTL
jgi:hypothetical protein